MARKKRLPLDKHQYLFKYEGSEIIYYRRTKGGKTIEFSTGETSIRKAKEFAENKLIKKNTKKSKIKSVRNPAVIDLWKEFIDSKKRSDRISAGTIGTYNSTYTVIISTYFKDKYLNELNQSLIESFEDWYLENHAERTYFNTKKHLVSFFKYLKKNQLINKDLHVSKKIESMVKKNKGWVPVGRVYTEGEIKKLREAAQGDPMMSFALDMYLIYGLRKMELLSLKRSAYSQDSDFLDVYMPKKDKWKKLYLSAKVKKLFNKYIASGVPSETYFFPAKRKDTHMASQIFDDKWTELKRATKIRNWNVKDAARIHDLRHTCATRFAESPVPDALACDVLGMSLEIYIKRYVHITDGARIKWGKKIF